MNVAGPLLFCVICVQSVIAQSADDRKAWRVSAWEEIELTVTPAAITNESLDLKLFDETNNNSHNAASFYYRASLKWAALPKSLRSKLYENREAWFDAPISELPAIEIGQWLDQLDAVFAELKPGLNANCDWGIAIDELTYAEQAELDFSAEQAVLNEFGDILRLKARLYAVNGEFDKAIASLADCIKLARDAGQLPVSFFGATMTSRIAFPALQMVNELAEMKGCPNMYSALQSLPRPIADYLSDIKLKHKIIERSFPFLDNPAESNRTQRQWRDVFLESMEQLGRAHDWNIEREYPNSWEEWVASKDRRLGVLFAKNYPVAKRELTKAGWNKEKLASMPVGQVIAIQTRRAWDAHKRMFAGIENLPAAEIHDRAVMIDQSDLIYGELHGCFPLNLVTVSQENLLRSRWQLVETSMIVQQLRDHLARKGKFPNAAQFKKMNSLVDPNCGLPFQYRRLENGDAQLQSVPGAYEGYDPEARNDFVRVRMTIRKGNQE